MSGCCPIHETTMLTYRAAERNKGEWICEICSAVAAKRLNRLFPPAPDAPPPYGN